VQTDMPTYTRTAILLHWMIAVLIIVMFFFGLYVDEQRKALLVGEAELGTVIAIFNWHKSIGLLVLALSIFRLVWRLMHRPPPLSLEVSAIERLLARVIHGAFYVLMIGIPLAGWLAISTSESSSSFFNNPDWRIPEIWGNDQGFHELLESVHKYAAFTMMGLLGLHIAAALKHHFLEGIDTITRMVPFIRARGQKSK